MFVLEDDDSRVTLLGSVHVLPESAYPLPASVDSAYAEAEIVTVEADTEDTAAMAESIRTRMLYADGRTLPDVLGKVRFAKLSALLQRLGFPTDGVAAVKPWAVQIMLAAFATEDSGYRPDLGLDLHLIQRARADGKDLLTLETADDQMALFDTAPEAEQIEDLLELVRTWDRPAADGSGGIADIVDAWGRGDEAELAAIASELSDAVLRDRNARWISQIEDMLAFDGDDVLVVVGAAHLVGPDSVVAMLRARGYVVTRR